jgi:hypothetical protein
MLTLFVKWFQIKRIESFSSAFYYLLIRGSLVQVQQGEPENQAVMKKIIAAFLFCDLK